MAYVKTTWEAGSTALSAENFNHLEEGVEDAHELIEDVDSNVYKKSEVDALIEDVDSNVYKKSEVVTLTGSTNVVAEGIAAWNLNLPSNIDPSKVMLLSVEQRRESGSAIGPWLQAGNIVHNNNAYPACSINESSKLLILNLYANFSSGTLRYRVRYIVL